MEKNFGRRDNLWGGLFSDVLTFFLPLKYGGLGNDSFWVDPLGTEGGGFIPGNCLSVSSPLIRGFETPHFVVTNSRLASREGAIPFEVFPPFIGGLWKTNSPPFVGVKKGPLSFLRRFTIFHPPLKGVWKGGALLSLLAAEIESISHSPPLGGCGLCSHPV